MIRIYDGNNYVRVQAETDWTGRPISTMYTNIEQIQEVPIVVWDGRSALTARREIYPEYKANREESGESIYASMKLLKSILKLSRAIQVEVPGYEADDVIAKLVEKYGDQIAHIHTTDGDMAALGVPMDKEPKTDPQWIRLYKACVGDPADNIPGIKGFGKGTWEKLDNNLLDHLEALLEGKIDDFDVTETPLSKQVVNWLSEPENIEQARIYYKIVGFLDVPQYKIDENTIVGQQWPEKVTEIIKEYEI